MTQYDTMKKKLITRIQITPQKPWTLDKSHVVHWFQGTLEKICACNHTFLGSLLSLDGGNTNTRAFIGDVLKKMGMC